MKSDRSVLLAILIMVAGCASGPKADSNIDWNSRIGSYTYDQAVAELGAPDVIGESNEGRMADWITKRGGNFSFGFGMGNAIYGPHGGAGVGVGTTISPPPHGEYLHLAFGRDGKLTGWSKVRH